MAVNVPQVKDSSCALGLARSHALLTIGQFIDWLGKQIIFCDDMNQFLLNLNWDYGFDLVTCHHV